MGRHRPNPDSAAGERYPEQSWLDPRVAVAPSSTEGRGLFATAPIAEGEVVMVLCGRVVTDEELQALGLVKYSSLAIGEHLNLLIADDSPVTFGNHSCDANLWMADAVTLVARRPIGPGEEITIDYALHTAGLPWRMVSHCGSPACRGVVTNDDWKRPDVQARYAGHFSPFLNARIAALRQQSGTNSTEPSADG